MKTCFFGARKCLSRVDGRLKSANKSPILKKYISGYVWRGPQIPAIECHGLTGMLQMNPPFMSKTSALHEHHASLYFVSSLTARLRRKTSVCDVLCRVPNPPQCVCCVFTLYRIVFWRARESYRMGFQFTHKNGDFGAISVKRREAVPRRSLKWRVTYRIDVHTILDGFSCRHQSLSGIV